MSEKSKTPMLSRKPTLQKVSYFEKDKHSDSMISKLARFNKDSAFSAEERQSLGLRGLLPPRVETINEQADRAIRQLREFSTPLEKYIYLNMLISRNETLFYKVVLEHLEETMPIVYTPTVGAACQKFGHNFRVTQGMYFTKNDKGKMRQMLDNWYNDKVDIIVVTDGSRILGLGDLGANGMGIPIGKLSLYVAGSGFHPSGTLPVMLDLGTNRECFLSDPDYLGMRHKRLEDNEYYELVDEFMQAVFDKWPEVLLQFEDFSNNHCFNLLDKYRQKYLCFNDDIQGTGAVILSGFINSLKVAGVEPKDCKLVFFGAGSAGVGVADQIVTWFKEFDMTTEEARSHFYFVDSKGLVTNNRGDKLASHKQRFARTDCEKQIKTLEEVVEFVKPNALIGLAGVGPHFTKKMVETMCTVTDKPIIMALSNPTHKAECTATQAYEWSDGKAIFASGSPFAPVEYKGKTYTPGQGNNMFIFPGLGFGAWLAKAKVVTDKMILVASRALADAVPEESIKQGNIYPRIRDIRSISAQIAAAVIEQAIAEDVAQIQKPEGDLVEWISTLMYQPEY